MYFCGLVWFCGSILISRGIFVCFATFVWPRVWSPAVCRHGFLQAKTFFYFVFGAAVACGGSVGDCACSDLWLRGRFATVFDLLCDFSGRRCGRVCLVSPSCVVRSAVALALFVPCVVGSTVMFFHSAVAFDCFAIVQGGSCRCVGQICGACLNLRLCLLGFSIVCIRIGDRA